MSAHSCAQIFLLLATGCFLFHNVQSNVVGVQPAAISLDINSTMLNKTSLTRPVCEECAAQNMPKFIKCLRKLDKGDSDYKKCFKELLELDDERSDTEKCATCICKELSTSGIDVDAYPEIKDMFCFSGDEFDYCRGYDETSDNEHYPQCGKGLICKTNGVTWGFCKKAICEDTNRYAKDKLELTCNHYEMLDICGRSDELKDEDFEAEKMCCACGGGSVPKKGADEPKQPSA